MAASTTQAGRVRRARRRRFLTSKTYPPPALVFPGAGQTHPFHAQSLHSTSAAARSARSASTHAQALTGTPTTRARGTSVHHSRHTATTPNAHSPPASNPVSCANHAVHGVRHGQAAGLVHEHPEKEVRGRAEMLGVRGTTRGHCRGRRQHGGAVRHGFAAGRPWRRRCCECAPSRQQQRRAAGLSRRYGHASGIAAQDTITTTDADPAPSAAASRKLCAWTGCGRQLPADPADYSKCSKCGYVRAAGQVRRGCGAARGGTCNEISPKVTHL